MLVNAGHRRCLYLPPKLRLFHLSLTLPVVFKALSALLVFLGLLDLQMIESIVLNKDSEILSLLYLSKTVLSSSFLFTANSIWIQLCLAVQVHLPRLHLLLAVEVQAMTLTIGTTMTIWMMRMKKNMNLGTMKIETTLNNNFYTYIVQYFSQLYLLVFSVLAMAPLITHTHSCIPPAWSSALAEVYHVTY